MATTMNRSTTNAATNTFVYWIVALVAAIFLLAYLMRAGPISDPSVIIAPPPIQSFPVPQ